jgi:hypothetical protein
MGPSAGAPERRGEPSLGLSLTGPCGVLQLRDEAPHAKVGVGTQAKGTDHRLGEAELVPGWRPGWPHPWAAMHLVAQAGVRQRCDLGLGQRLAHSRSN